MSMGPRSGVGALALSLAKDVAMRLESKAPECRERDVPVPATNPPAGPRAGMGLAELLVAFTILLMGLAGLVRIMLGNFALNEQARGVTLAMHSSRALAERMMAVDPQTAFAFFNDFAGDDPVGGADGATFGVLGLDAAPDDPDGIVGEILFPVQAGAPGVISELANPNFPSLPRDLNLDGDAVDANVTADAAVLPVIIRMRWVGPSGTVQTFELPTVLSGA